jgi:uncharacterized protein YgbK (DUF1537 family)
VCSTFDSSPRVGSIGRALEIGQRVFAPEFVPIVVGQPRLGRYCAFGNLFARSGADSEVFRLDRHPTMRQHPSTPMDESDLRLHLSRQTSRTVALFDSSDLECSPEVREQRLEEVLRSRPDAVLFDVMREADLCAIGTILDQQAPLFAIGSSAVEHALALHWQARGEVTGVPAYAAPSTRGTGQEVRAVSGPLIVVSGSCSPVTARQIAFAREHGFMDVPLQIGEEEHVISMSHAALTAGQSVVIHTCLGPEDPRHAAASGADSAQTFGTALGRILATLLRQSGVRRAVVVGGDTSGYVVRALGIHALEMAAPTAPGAPVCRAYASDALDGVQLILKGGQVGRDAFFVDSRGKMEDQ